jgi:hypothetical protein
LARSFNTSNGFSSKILALQPQFVHVPAIRSFSIIATSLPACFNVKAACQKYNQAKDVLEQLEHGLKQLNKK